MDAVATFFRSKKMWCLFEGGYHSKYVYTCIIVQILYSASLAIQDNEACCLTALRVGIHVRDSVDSKKMYPSA